MPSDSLRTRSYGIAIAKNGLFGDDALGLAVSRPVFAADGGEFITLPGGQGQPQFFTRSNMLAGTTPETDIEVGYVTTFLDGSLALQTNASYQMNFEGQNGANAVSLLSRAQHQVLIDLDSPPAEPFAAGGSRANFKRQAFFRCAYASVARALLLRYKPQHLKPSPKDFPWPGRNLFM